MAVLLYTIVTTLLSIATHRCSVVLVLRFLLASLLWYKAKTDKFEELGIDFVRGHLVLEKVDSENSEYFQVFRKG